MSFFDSKQIGEFVAPKFKDKRVFTLWCIAGVSIVILLGTIYALFIRPSSTFPVHKIITIKEKSGLNEIAKQLYDLKIIKSQQWFRAAVILKSGQRGVLAGDYYF